MFSRFWRSVTEVDNQPSPHLTCQKTTLKEESYYVKVLDGVHQRMNPMTNTQVIIAGSRQILFSFSEHPGPPVNDHNDGQVAHKLTCGEHK